MVGRGVRVLRRRSGHGRLPHYPVGGLSIDVGG